MVGLPGALILDDPPLAEIAMNAILGTWAVFTVFAVFGVPSSSSPIRRDRRPTRRGLAEWGRSARSASST